MSLCSLSIVSILQDLYARGDGEKVGTTVYKTVREQGGLQATDKHHPL